MSNLCTSEQAIKLLAVTFEVKIEQIGSRQLYLFDFDRIINITIQRAISRSIIADYPEAENYKEIIGHYLSVIKEFDEYRSS